MISLAYIDDIRHSLTRIGGLSQCWLTEIITSNEPIANCSKMIEAKYAEILYLINRDTFRAVLKTKLPDGANLITARYVLSIKSYEDKEER